MWNQCAGTCPVWRLYVHLNGVQASCMFPVAVTIKSDELPYAPVWLGRFIICLAALLFPFYLLDVSLAVLQVNRSASGVWLPIWRLAIGDMLKLSVLFWVGFYARNYAERRASCRMRRKDALQLSILSCVFFAVLAPWYVSLPAVVFNWCIYSWEMRNIRCDERLQVFENSRTATTKILVVFKPNLGPSPD